ncbi:HU family DNA-binding protein [Metamycoplasma alkalescens]|uniref:HU family DNA-binding protein n=1 Tax=Metamycoplasma alkalescens TaxID=45363 RepID=UPI003CFEA011
MTKKELIKITSEKTGFQHAMVESILEEMVNILIEEVANENQVTISGLGVLNSKLITSKTKQHNITKETIIIPEKMAPKFKFSNVFKQKINDAYQKIKK